MSPRIRYIAQNRLALISVFGALVLLISGIVASRAAFNFRTTNPGSALTAGNLHHVNSKGGATIFTTSPLMIPGDTLVGNVTITNDGDLPGYFEVTPSAVTDTPGPNGGNLSAALNLHLADGATVIYDGPLVGSPAATLDGDLVAPGTQPFPTSGPNSAHTYTLTLTFADNGAPASNLTGDNVYRGSSTAFTLDWLQNDR